MSGDYRRLLEATITYLEDLKADGSQFVPVARSTLADLSRPSLGQSRPPSPAEGLTPAKPVVAPIPRASAPAATVTALPIPGQLGLGSSPPLDPAAKAAAMADLSARALVCQKCPHLASSRKNVVFGVGDINSPLMFVGEAPGADEDEAGEPFVGKAGQLLNRMIMAMGLTRERVYIANILKCRPDTPSQKSGNRRPEPQEMKTCLPYLLEQIDLIRPRVMVALGGVAIEGLFGKTAGITKMRGTFQLFHDIPVMPTYHPAYLLRNPANSEKRKVWEDLLQVMERLAMPISEKQRRYFLKE